MRCWIGVASAHHVARGRNEGFMQVCHGKAGPLRRLRAGDRVAYYSPGLEFGVTGAKNRCQSFTAMGVVRDDRVYAFDMGGGFVPFRRDVDWFSGQAASILPLLERLEFTRAKKNWGYAFRFGLLEISEADMDVIADTMGARKAA
ncbi:MAG: EVE domain-containing protein [Rhabdaerophilum sp.]